MTVEDSRKVLPAEAYPPWVVFSQRQKLKWLNHHLKKLWPYIDQAASEVIREKVEPTLEKYRSPIIDDLKFSKLTLGTVAPQFTGVSIIEGDPEEIIMELELQWDGNPHIVLDITTLVGVSLPIEVKDIGFTGVFRIIFKPLVEEFPCFGAICYSLREKKKLDFTLKVCGDISTIPGVLDALKSTILDAIEDSMMWPVRNIIPILPGDYSDLQLKPVGTLEVKLIQGKELTNKDIVGKSDPFAEVFIRPQRERIKKSKVINNTLNPIWNENFEFEVEDASTQHLTVKVYDDEGIQASELIGCAQVQLKDLEPGKVKSVWLALVKDLEIQRDTKNRGQIHLELLYCPFGTQNIFMNFVDPDFRLTDLEKALQHGAKPATQKTRNLLFRGVLSVTVISAEDLPATDLSGKCDPYVVLILKKSEQREKTRVSSF
nr:synaptotagmin-5-like isoform X1 [Ipomoea batatas]